MNKKTLMRMYTKKYDYKKQHEINKSYKTIENQKQKKKSLKDKLKETLGGK